MTDMLVILRDLPDVSDDINRLATEGVVVRQPIAPEKDLVANWATAHFAKGWGNEVEASFNHQPVSCFIAQAENKILGFACYEATGKNFFGPTGVLEEYRNLKIGKVLLIKSLEALKNMGYAYAIIGGVGPIPYYEKAVGARVIEGSERSIYQNMLKRND
ncbi:MAG: GNAT family N-acetyltransferase [Cyclobacteriaceae bacterium]|nr:GNAT family N-acetyltransferase [Cyclobacteriaceae bacterium HetDA_MAG_MS6]